MTMAMTVVENGRFRVWRYTRPSGHSKSSGFLRGTSTPIVEWAYALVDVSARPELVYLTSEAKNGFASPEEAVAAARSADWARASESERAAAAAIPTHWGRDPESLVCRDGCPACAPTPSESPTRSAGGRE